MIYIGSGTSATHGVSQRLGNYDSHTLVPSRITKVLSEGYTIVHKGLLCSAPIPSATMLPVLRVLFVALEAVFTFVFWALSAKTDYGYGMVHICPWARDTLKYDGLCSHSALTKRPASNLSLSPAELEAQALESAQQLSKNVRRCREKAKSKDPAEYKAKAIEHRKKFVDNHADATKEIEKRSIAKAVEEKRHYCDICDHAFYKGAALKKHLAGPMHAAKAARLEKDPPSQENKEPKYYCGACDQEFTRKAGLTNHLATPRHAAKAARLEEAVRSQQN